MDRRTRRRQGSLDSHAEVIERNLVGFAGSPVNHDSGNRYHCPVTPWKHAQASDILCAIEFTESHFILRCEDDGIGIDPQFASNSGRPGHWGLIGMRETAQKTAATL